MLMPVDGSPIVGAHLACEILEKMNIRLMSVEKLGFYSITGLSLID